jgi:hypothetical protein
MGSWIGDLAAQFIASLVLTPARERTLIVRFANRALHVSGLLRRYQIVRLEDRTKPIHKATRYQLVRFEDRTEEIGRD